MKKLLIIDSSSMLVSHFMATLPMEYMKAKDEEEKKKYLYKIMQTKSGIYTNGVFSMLKAILYLLKNQKPDYICTCFDKGRKNTFRKKLYNDYKAQRKETDPILSSQFKLIEEILDQIGIKMFMSEEYEADDFAGSIAEKFKNEADIKTLKFLKEKNGEKSDEYIKDEKNVYYVDEENVEIKKIENADYKTFQVIEYLYAKDKNNVYY